MSEFTGYVKDKKLPLGRNLSSIEAYASIEDNGQPDSIQDCNAICPMLTREIICVPNFLQDVMNGIDSICDRKLEPM